MYDFRKWALQGEQMEITPWLDTLALAQSLDYPRHFLLQAWDIDLPHLALFRPSS